MENHTIVMPEHLNQHGYLFGGVMLKWVDEFAWIAASLDYPGCSLITIGMDNVEFRQPVSNGAIVRFNIDRAKQGNTSVQYKVEVFARDDGASVEKWAFSTNITFVRIDENGRKCALIAENS